MVQVDRRVAVSAGVPLAAVGCNGRPVDTCGPLTTSTAVWSIVISLVVGGLAGLLLNSRWAMLVVPAVSLVVSRDHPDGRGLVRWSMVCTQASAARSRLITGRGFQALLTLVPMALGAALGAGWARTRTDRHVSRWSLVLEHRRRCGGDGGTVGALTAAPPASGPNRPDLGGER